MALPFGWNLYQKRNTMASQSINSIEKIGKSLENICSADKKSFVSSTLAKQCRPAVEGIENSPTKE